MPIHVHEYTNISELDNIYNNLQELESLPIINELDEVLQNWFNNLDELVKNKDNIIYNTDWSS